MVAFLGEWVFFATVSDRKEKGEINPRVGRLQFGSCTWVLREGVYWGVNAMGVLFH